MRVLQESIASLATIKSEVSSSPQISPHKYRAYCMLLKSNPLDIMVSCDICLRNKYINKRNCLGCIPIQQESYSYKEHLAVRSH